MPLRWIRAVSADDGLVWLGPRPVQAGLGLWLMQARLGPWLMQARLGPWPMQARPGTRYRSFVTGAHAVIVPVLR
jgi:hypothetical protein